jgi:hypothetical protein
MDIGVLSRDNQVYDLIIKSNIAREMPIYNNLIRATLIDKMDSITGKNELKNRLQEIRMR